jgi:rhodanese-related sulfurtransferase
MPRGRSLPRLLARDASASGLIAVAGLGVGLLANVLRPHPLPWRYVSKERRLDQALHSAVPSPKANVSPISNVKPRAIELEEFQRLAMETQGIVIDARSDLFFRAGHVPGALNLSREAFEKDYAALSPVLAARKGQPIAVYCSGHDCQDSELVAEALIKLGFGDVLVYPEGWEEWTAAGLPQEPPPKV